MATKKTNRKVKSKKVEGIHVPRMITRLFPNVTSAVDADKPIDVEVKKQDCDTAEPLNPAECALARAVKREFHADGAVIGMAASYVIQGNKAFRFKTSQRVARELVSFDRHSDFQPGQYSMSPMSPTQRHGADQRRRKDPRSRHDRAPIVHHLTEKVRIVAKFI